METRIINTDKLNFMYGEFLEKKHAALPFDDDIIKGFTFVSENDCDAFALNDPKSFFKFTRERDNTNVYMAVLRCMIPYAIVDKMNDYDTGIYILSILKNHMLIAFRDTLKLSEYEDITFKRHGNPNSFFKESDNFAGVEVRAFTKKKDI